MGTETFNPPVDRLLTYGERRARANPWPDYAAELGLTESDVPELIRMTTSQELYEDEEEPYLRFFATLHARRALGQLQAIEAVEPLVSTLTRLDNDGYYDDWLGEDMPDVLSMIGPAAVGPAVRFLADVRFGSSSRIVASVVLEKVAAGHLETRDEVVAALTRQLEAGAEADPALNGFIVSALTALEAVESLPQIRAAYEQGWVDEMIQGSLEDVEIELGVRPAPPGWRAWLNEPILPAPAAPAPKPEWRRVGRNEPCPCGSGQKFKRCCLKKLGVG